MIKILEFITEVIGYIRIVLSPTLLGIFLGLIIYNFFQNLAGLIAASFIAFVGLMIGIVWATNKFKTTGTVYFLSRVNASPDLDNLKQSEENKNISQE